MNRPNRVLGWISLFLLAVVLIVLVLVQPLAGAFLANPVFNGTILAVLLVGIALNVRQVVRLGPDAMWVEAVRNSSTQQSRPPAPPRNTRLQPLIRAAGNRWENGIPRLSTMTMRTVLDGVRSRLDEERDVSRYFIGLLIFLGLLGTFWGLLDTLGAVGGVISGLTLGGDDVAAMFEELRAGLQAPMEGMGTAFSSSLFGLAGALVLGFVDLQAGHAQNRFYNDVEEWLAGGARGGSMLEGGEQTVPAYIEALLEQTSDSLDKLQRAVAHQAEERRTADASLNRLTEQVEVLADQLRSEQRAIHSLNRAQAELQPILQRLAENVGQRSEEDDEARAHLRNLDAAINRLSDNLSSQRGQLAEELRSEIRLLAKTLAGSGTRSGNEPRED